MLLENIQRLCEKNNITLWSLERKLKIGNGVIAKWARSSPRVETVQKVADYFGVAVDDLLAKPKKKSKKIAESCTTACNKKPKTDC